MLKVDYAPILVENKTPLYRFYAVVREGQGSSVLKCFKNSCILIDRTHLPFTYQLVSLITVSEFPFYVACSADLDFFNQV